jgi:hypothetical protein
MKQQVIEIGTTDAKLFRKNGARQWSEKKRKEDVIAVMLAGRAPRATAARPRIAPATVGGPQNRVARESLPESRGLRVAERGGNG